MLRLGVRVGFTHTVSIVTSFLLRLRLGGVVVITATGASTVELDAIALAGNAIALTGAVAAARRQRAGRRAARHAGATR